MAYSNYFYRLNNFYKVMRTAALATTLAITPSLSACGGAVRKQIKVLDGQVKTLDTRVSKVEEKTEDLSKRVEVVEQSPQAERPVMLLAGHGYDKIFGIILGRLTETYQNKDARRDAEYTANSILILPRGDGKYTAFVMIDKNGDGKPTHGVDVTLGDVVDEKVVEKFTLDTSQLPLEARKWLFEFVTVGRK